MTAQEHLKQGNALYEEKAYEAAEAAFRQAVELDSQSADAWVGLANACWRLKKWEESQSHCETALAIDEKHARAWHRLGAVYKYKKLYDEALAAFQKATELDPQDAYPWNGLGIVYYAIKDYDQAKAAYQKAIELDPQDADPWYGLGIVYLDLKEYDQAKAAYHKATELDPQDADPWNGLGIVYGNLKDYDQAKAAFLKAIELEPQYAAPWHGLGEVYRDLKDRIQAKAAFQKAIELDPRYAAPWNGLGIVYLDLKDRIQAKASFQKAIKLDPQYAAPWNNLGNVYLDLEDYDQAKTAFLKAIELDPQLAAPWHSLGNVYYELKDYDQAKAAFQKATELDPQEASPWSGLGNVYSNLKAYGKAKAAYQKAIELDPQDAAPWHGLGNVYYGIKDYNQAKVAYQKATELDLKYAYPWNGLGNVYYGIKDYNQAKAAYQKATELDPQYAAPWHGLGNVYLNLKEYTKAQAAYQKSIEIAPQDAKPWDGLGIVYYTLQEGNEAACCFLRAEKLGAAAVASNCFVLFSKLDTHAFFSYRIIRSYMPEEEYASWERYLQTTLANATPLKAYITWQSLSREQGGLPAAQWPLWLGLIHYFMGDPAVALQYLEQSQQENKGKDLMAAYYQVQACYDFHEPDGAYLQPALAQAAAYLQPKPSFWKRLSGGAQQLDTAGVLQCYYAGQIFVLNGAYEKALSCFERVEKQYLPAAYMALWACHELKNFPKKAQKAAALLKREAKERRFTEGLPVVPLELDEPDFWKPFFHVAQYFELMEAIDILRYAAAGLKGKDKLPIAKPKAQKYYHQLWQLRPEDLDRINRKILEALNYRSFDSLFDDKLAPKLKQAPKLTEAMIHARLDQYEDSELRAAFERLRQLAAAGKAEQGLGELIRQAQFKPEQYQLFHAFFFSEGQLSDYERVLLDFYSLIVAMDAEARLTPSQLAMAKTGAGEVISDGLAYAIGMGASLAVPGLPLAAFVVSGLVSRYALKMATAALTEQLGAFLNKERPAFASYADFKAQFEQHIGQQFRERGAEAFFERYPIGELYWPAGEEE